MCLTITNSIPPSTFRLIVLLYNIWLYPSGKKAWYSIASILHTDDITSLVLVLPLYFPRVGSIISTHFPLRRCHLIGKQKFSACSTSALKIAEFPQITSSLPFIRIAEETHVEIIVRGI